MKSDRRVKGRPVALWALKSKDAPAIEAIMNVINVMGEINPSSPEEIRSLAAAWKALCGLNIPPNVLRRMINHNVRFELILKYALPPLLPVTADVFKEHFSKKFTEIAA